MPESSQADSPAADFSESLAELRRRIDAVDREILAKLNERAELVRGVGALKQGGRRSPVYVASRERDLIAALAESNEGPFPSAAIGHVFREIISATRSLEGRARVAFLGPEGTFSHQAAVRQFGTQVELEPLATFRDVYDAVERGAVQFGVVPVENTTSGAVTESIDILVESQVLICGELMLPVTQNLLFRGEGLEDVRRVASHPQPLAQCREWLQKHLPGVETVQTASTAAAAELAAAEDGVAAIGGEIAADTYGLDVLRQEIQDVRGNTTRFLVIGTETPAPSGNDLTSAVFTLHKDQSGALHQLLEPFAKHSVNLTSIQSRPMKGKPWEYLFFVDMSGHADDAAVAAALEEAAARAHSSKVLGSFPRAATTAPDRGKVQA